MHCALFLFYEANKDDYCVRYAVWYSLKKREASKGVE